MVVDLDKLNELRDGNGWDDAELARRMGLHQSSISKIRAGGGPSPKFIHGALTVFPVPYKELFSLRARAAATS